MLTVNDLKDAVKDYFLCLFSKRIVCKSEPEVHFTGNYVTRGKIDSFK